MTRLGKTVFAGIALGLVALGGGEILPTRGQPLSIDDVAAQKPRSDAPRSDLDRIRGTWVRVSTDGRKADRLVTMVVKGPAGRPKALVPAGAGEFIFEWKTEGSEGSSSNRVLLDPTRNPRTLDFFPEQAAAPEVCPGIYKLEGDTLTICFRVITGERPTEFVSGKQSEILDVYRRAKP